MFLPSKDGILCDYCGLIYKDNFSYYSTRSTKFVVTNNFKNNGGDAGFNIDMCCVCYDEIVSTVKINIGPYVVGKMKCDLSKKYGSNNFTYYVVYFDKIDVNKDSKDPITIYKNVMDLNIVYGFDDLINRVNSIKSKININEVWS